MDPMWTLPELVAEVATRIAALPAPKNGQVRAVPDDRTVRYYGTIGLLDRPVAMRGRTALYGRRHVAQVVAIKRLQTMGRSLAEIQALWPTLEDHTLARMSGVALDPMPSTTPRAFWKREPGSRVTPNTDDAGSMESGVLAEGSAVIPAFASAPAIGSPSAFGAAAPVELRIELAPNIVLSLSVTDESVTISPADVQALRAAAAPLVAELASRRLTPHPGDSE